jgi:hypothetical protein
MPARTPEAAGLGGRATAPSRSRLNSRVTSRDRQGAVCEDSLNLNQGALYLALVRLDKRLGTLPSAAYPALNPPLWRPSGQ